MPNQRQRREAERRRLQRQLAQRAHREKRRKRVLFVASVVGTVMIMAIVLTAVVATNNDSSTPASGPTTTAPVPTTSSATPPAAPYPCSWTTGGTPAREVEPPPTTTPPKTGKVDILANTTQGKMTFQLDRSEAPCTVESFASLVEQNYFDGTSCHRLTTEGIYVLQCGDPTATGGGGPGYTIPDEATGDEGYPAGTIAMARTASPHSGGSQFFIVYKNSPNLQQQLGKLQYTIFGKVTSGLDVIEKVAAAGSDNSNGQGDGKPKKPITLTTLGVVE